jgi:hypothetical protein
MELYPSKATNNITTICLWLVNRFTYLSAPNALDAFDIFDLSSKFNSCVKIGCPLKFVPLPMSVILICVVTIKVNLLGELPKGIPLHFSVSFFTGHQ